MNKRGRKGFTLTELAIVMLVVSAVMGVVWVAASKMWDNYRIYRFTQQMLTTVQNIRDQYLNARQLPAAGDITKTLDGLNVFPQEMRRNAATPGATPIDHPLNNTLAGGSFYVLGVAGPSGAIDRFRLSARSLTKPPCIRLLMLQPLTDAEIGIVRIGTASASTAIDNTGNSASVTLPLTATTAASWCAVAGNTNEVDWDFKLHN